MQKLKFLKVHIFTDTPFLLRFLRTKKYSVPQACAMLERYLTLRQVYPHWFQKLDPLDPKIAAVIDAGYLVPLPKRDAEGRRVVLSCMGNCDLLSSVNLIDFWIMG